MYMVIGLGNPDREYENTRHNFGRRLVTEYARQMYWGWNQYRSSAEYVRLDMGDIPILLGRTQTYMNESGLAVKALSQFFRIPPEKIIIVYDDLSLDLGRIKIGINKSSGGHNGIKSVIEHLGSSNFIRLRLGIGPQKGDASDFVLKRFPTTDKRHVDVIVERGIECMSTCIADGLDKAANQFNSKTFDKYGS